MSSGNGVLSSLAKAEIAAVVALRESEAALQREMDRGGDTKKARQRVTDAINCIARCQIARERVMQKEAIKVINWWKEQSAGRRSCPVQIREDCWSICRPFGVPVAASQVQSVPDIRNFLHATSMHPAAVNPSERFGGCVAPMESVPELATLQNLPAADHALLTLLTRYIGNRKPTEKQLISAINSLNVSSRYQPALIAFNRHVHVDS